ncbi:MAG: hypothetical protein ACOC5G_02585 [Acidobacteriota bacterium]
MAILHTATNMLSDYFDYRRGLDRIVSLVSGVLSKGGLRRYKWLWELLCAVFSGVDCFCGKVLLY